MKPNKIKDFFCNQNNEGERVVGSTKHPFSTILGNLGSIPKFLTLIALFLV